MLLEVLRGLNKTVLLVTHDLDEALYLSSHIVSARGRPDCRHAAREGFACTRKFPRSKAMFAPCAAIERRPPTR